VLPNAPKAEIVDVKTDRESCCKDGPLSSNKFIVNPKTEGLKNVVVWIRPDNDERTSTFPREAIHPELQKHKPVQHVIDQPKCQFEPRVVAAREGDTLLMKNSASINHNINYNSDAESFNVTLPPVKSKDLDKPLQAQRTPIAFKCDIHGWMEGRLRVFDHPYFAITDDNGNFSIPKVPVGKWRIVYWHEGGFHRGKDGILGFPIEVKAGQSLELPALKMELPK
jgi:plastocyanin